MRTVAETIADHALQALTAHRDAGGGCLTLGLCGAQGCGKSPVVRGVGALLAAAGLRVAVLSLDDFYLDIAARRQLGRRVHPLLRTRGVPGTHDLRLAIAVLDALSRGGTPLLPRFDKATDTVVPHAAWTAAAPATDVILFEGWCVGARPQAEAALLTPVNRLEAQHDPAGVWRRHVNRMLAQGYRRLFDRIDTLVLLAAPDFPTVLGWRQQQEHQLRAGLLAKGRDLGLSMDDAAVAEFVQHYERLTRHILAEMPARARLVVRLDSERRMVRSC